MHFVFSLTSVCSNSFPEWSQDAVEALDTVRMRGLGQRRQRQCCDASDFALVVIESVLYDLHEALEVCEDGASGEDGDLLHDLDARVTSLPTLLALTHGLQERQQTVHTKSRRDNGERTSGRVAHLRHTKQTNKQTNKQGQTR